MKIAIMQPYVFPYIGYFQLINAVDRFVVHDDVQWIKGGWINRNRILVQGKAHYITFPLKKDSTLLAINERQLSADCDQHKAKILRQIQGAYGKAPYYQQAIDVVAQSLATPLTNMALFATHTLQTCCQYLAINTEFVTSSQLAKNNALHGQNRVLELNQLMAASHYINPIGGTALYNRDDFAKRHIKLSFLQPSNIVYQQVGNHQFVPFLSIIDVMMNNSVEQIRGYLAEFELV
ncbi:WbqC family protein [Neiella sp. HB171785]|uniref:WbqC family protein n=1 Tax=Neiella litorisoli TaxID=2771431 RepID=A0A8J6QV40_9GAMM|nr:WbqC family protein [Neiella litorisoli]MBD1390847.1 WbqC family protein [Neiella litorisoli]